MAIRYSADAEVRVTWNARERLYVGSVRDPYVHWKGKLEAPWSSAFRSKTSPEAYDAIAKRMLRSAQRWAASQGRRLMLAKKDGDIFVDRMFQAPCPIAKSGASAGDCYLRRCEHPSPRITAKARRSPRRQARRAPR